MALEIVPVTRDEAVEFIARVHRHHGRPVGYRFAVGVALADVLVGVATAGRPSSRVLQEKEPRTFEVTRVATDGARNACSALYGTCWRAGKALGYLSAITYTQEDESGASLRAAGWWIEAELPPRRGWHSPNRPRDGNGNDGVARLRWRMRAAGESNTPRGQGDKG